VEVVDTGRSDETQRSDEQQKYLNSLCGKCWHTNVLIKIFQKGVDFRGLLMQKCIYEVKKLVR